MVGIITTSDRLLKMKEQLPAFDNGGGIGFYSPIRVARLIHFGNLHLLAKEKQFKLFFQARFNLDDQNGPDPALCWRKNWIVCHFGVPSAFSQ
jgi:hypothetical protein